MFINKLNLVTMATNKIVYELFLALIKEVVIKLKSSGKLFWTTVFFMATKSYSQLKFLNLVTMATNKIVSELFLMLIMEVVIQI